MKLGRPPRPPGQTYTIEDIPMKDFRRFKQRCKRVNLTMRDVLISMIQNAGQTPPGSNPWPK